MSSVAHRWGSTEAEREAAYPCDRHLSPADHALFRAVDVEAPAAVLFRWLCQLRAAPYSYDWIDNWGHRSPRQLIDGLERLEDGQRVMRIFVLVAHEDGRHLTLVMRPPATRLFGEVAGTYQVVPVDDRRCRLVVKLLARYPHGPYGALLRRLLPWGDLVMMRRQLLTLKRLAEASASAGGA